MTVKMEATAFFRTTVDPAMISTRHPRPALFTRTSSWRVTASPSPRPRLHNATSPVKSSSSDLESTRPLIKFPPSLWGDRFLSVPTEDKLELDALAREIDELKPRVREMLLFSPSDDKERIRSIHSIISLGLSYHFEGEIEDALNHAFGNLDGMMAGEYDLYTVSIMFQVFRLYGHNMSCDVFDRFKGDDGKFEKCLESDARGMLSLYEAAHLGTTSNDMDEAMSFAANHLESLEAQPASPHLYSLIRKALHRPRHRTMEILFAREYISFYEQEEDHDETLLEFAKISFKYTQLHYIRELEIVSNWWKGLDLPSKLPYFRDRLVESYFATIGVYVEPRYSFQRMMMAKLFIIATVVDDSCDAYGTLPEVASLVDGVERWDLGVIDNIPDYMKIVFRHALLILAEVEREVRPDVRSQVKQEAMEELKTIMRAFLRLAEWARAGHVPTFEEYMEVGLVTTGIELLMKFALVWTEHTDGKHVAEWLRSRPKIIQTVNAMFRLSNDKASYKHETSRGEVANGINCYMKQFRATEEEAVGAVQRMYDDKYKMLVEEFLKESAGTDVPRKLLKRVLKTASVFDVFYKDGDGFTYPRGDLEKHISSVFVHRIRLL